MRWVPLPHRSRRGYARLCEDVQPSTSFKIFEFYYYYYYYYYYFFFF
jgi:hypothetical protein